MTEERDILKILSENPSISQRKIAETTGISLGQVNFLIKKCVKKGLIKIEGQTSKSIRYNVTPRGIAEKAALTLEYVKTSYGAIITLSDTIKNLADKFESEGYKIVVFGQKDEMFDICKLALGYRALYITSFDYDSTFKNNWVIFFWSDNILKEFDKKTIKAVNILL